MQDPKSFSWKFRNCTFIDSWGTVSGGHKLVLFGLRNALSLGGRFGYFLFFLLGEGGRGVRGRREGGGSIFHCKSRGGGLQEGKGPRGQEGVCGELGIFGGGGPKYFFSGPKCPSS